MSDEQYPIDNEHVLLNMGDLSLEQLMLNNTSDHSLKLNRKELAFNHIIKYYPYFKQLNVLMSEDKLEIYRMRNFINAVRAWENSGSEDTKALELIKP